MLFNSINFLVFFPIVVFGYFVLRGRVLRNAFLLLAGYFFYMNWEPAYALLLLTSTGITYFAGLGIDGSASRRGRRMWLTASVVLNLLILFFFKYYAFAADNLTVFLEGVGLSVSFPEFRLLLPVGISFYVFQALGYSIDVYRGQRAERSFVTYALFVSFFPQLVAGPIERSSNLLPQFKREHSFSYENVMSGLRLMLWGYFLKLVLADRCALYVDPVFNNVSQHSGSSLLIASVLFTFQIYGDFAGYSLTAIGAAKAMGFELMENFRRPYLSASVTEFWHRWHISLSTWFRDYVYIPLGGSRVGRVRTYGNLLVTFLLSGLWHGANWTFVTWGLLHGFMLCAERAVGWNRRQARGVVRVLRCVLTFALVGFAWIFFRADSLADALTIIGEIFTDFGSPYMHKSNLIASVAAIAAVMFKDMRDELRGGRCQGEPSWLSQHLYIVMMTAVIILFGVLNGDQFIYFQF